MYCKFRDEQFALYDEYAKRHGMLMKTLLVVNVLYYDDYYDKGGVTQAEICQRTFQSKQTVNLIIRNLSDNGYVTVEERKENKREKSVRITESGKKILRKSRPPHHMGRRYGNVNVLAGGAKTAHRPLADVYKKSDRAYKSGI